MQISSYYNKYNYYIKNYLLLICGLVIFSIIIYIRFLRARLSKDIPFSLTLYGLSILIIICVMYLYTRKKILWPKESTQNIALFLKYFGKLSQYVSNALKTLDSSIKTNSNSTVDSYHVVRNKEVLVTLLKYFPELQPNQINDNRILLEYLIKHFTLNPHSVVSKQAQVTLEVLFNRRRFDENLLKELFPKFDLVDVVEKNNGISDISTTFNMLIGDYLVNKYPYLLNADPRIITATILPYFDTDTLPEYTRKFIEYSQLVTGNTIPDLTLCGVPFDWKATPSNNKNFIVLWDYEQFNLHKDVMKYHDALLKDLAKHKDNLTLFQKELFNFLRGVLEDKSISMLTKQHLINEFVMNKIKFMTPRDRASLIFPVDNKPFTPNQALLEETKSVTLPLKRSTVDAGATKKAIFGIINTRSSETKENFHGATNDSFKLKEDVVD